MTPYLGMYVHMHWGYHHPYAARTWTIGDWRSYATGLSRLGYNLVMIWPLTESMPDPPTTSDLAHLEKLHAVIDMLHAEFGMTALITFGANTVGNEHAAAYTFEERPFFKTDLRLNPGDPAAVDRLLRIRRSLYRHLANADGMVVIDSDPGGYVGSTNREFAALLQRHMDMLDELNPSAMLYYWLWVGWESYNRFWEQAEKTGTAEIRSEMSDWETVLDDLLAHPDDRWRLLVCWPQHRDLAARRGVDDRVIYFPYGLVEGEPTFPLTNCDPSGLAKGIGGYPWGRPYLGCMANAQTHTAQLPHTYLFAHFARGGTQETADLRSFAADLVPGMDELLVDAWTTLQRGLPARARDIAAAMAAERERLTAAGKLLTGPLSGLLMGEPGRFLCDLEMQLAFYADMKDFVDAREQGLDGKPEARALVASWRAWMFRTGFVDAYGGPVERILHPTLRALRDPAIERVLAKFDDWHNPAVRNGVVPRLISALAGYAESGR